MSNVLNKTTLEYRKSVNTPEYSETDWVVNPDVSGITDQEGKIIIPQKYWKLNGNKVEEMTLSEKTVVDEAELQERKNKADLSYQDMKIVLTALIKVINSRLNVNQKITTQEMIDAIKNEIT